MKDAFFIWFISKKQLLLEDKSRLETVYAGKSEYFLVNDQKKSAMP
ncbi:hypothetical protein MTBBW1_760066 [Desulfamplus magnetovallimortis]|uniref:Uncharacterized protein n=1 Tax=Desulfamplus magnetovallimortis TaxID=1246637 RepID=A0A1W1HJQ1_9BACT|nr:hypothetical protein MTBBW1_760066 [Desulfamplus magnetovallimortis]